MPPIPLADNFLAGAILSLVLPAALLIALVIWYALAIKRIGERGSSGRPPARQPEQGGTGVAPQSEVPPGESS